MIKINKDIQIDYGFKITLLDNGRTLKEAIENGIEIMNVDYVDETDKQDQIPRMNSLASGPQQTQGNYYLNLKKGGVKKMPQLDESEMIQRIMQMGQTFEEPKEQVYVGTKIVRGIPMTWEIFNHLYGQPIIVPIDEKKDQPGYRVTYAGGYVSWSPKEVFEEAYRLISNQEKGLF